MANAAIVAGRIETPLAAGLDNVFILGRVRFTTIIFELQS